ncbi:MAG: hypothetical protein DRI40_08420 [Chloroflexi bacterium]|nr:MAG: hypothetical protein DRI40_08420 [Chloroflexota bacterium]
MGVGYPHPTRSLSTPTTSRRPRQVWDLTGTQYVLYVILSAAKNLSDVDPSLRSDRSEDLSLHHLAQSGLKLTFVLQIRGGLCQAFYLPAHMHDYVTFAFNFVLS